MYKGYRFLRSLWSLHVIFALHVKLTELPRLPCSYRSTGGRNAMITTQVSKVCRNTDKLISISFYKITERKRVCFSSAVQLTVHLVKVSEYPAHYYSVIF